MAGKHAKQLTLMKSFGKAVRFYRNKLGYSQEALADRAQLDRSYMSQIERGIKNATINSVWRIGKALEVAPSELLSLTEQFEAAASAALQQGAKAAGKSDRVVLVVDDDRDICLSVDAVLQDAGFATRQAECGFDAIRLMASETVHAVVSDIRMANGNGLELLDAVRRHHPQVPVFFITGFDDLSAEDAMRRGAKGIFNKPFDFDSFVNSLQSSLVS